MQLTEIAVTDKMANGQLTLLELLTQMEQIDAAIIELTPEGMAELAERLELKVDNYHYFLTKLDAEAERLKGIEDQVKAARYSVERKAKQLREILVFSMQSKGFLKLPGDVHQVSLRASKSVKVQKDTPNVDDACEFPQFIRTKYEWDKIALSDALKKKDAAAEDLAKFEEKFSPIFSTKRLDA